MQTSQQHSVSDAIELLCPRAMEELFELLQHDRGAVVQILEMFLTEAPDTQRRLSATEAEARRAVHSLRGTAAAVGALRLSSLCSRVDSAGEVPIEPCALEAIRCELTRASRAVQVAIERIVGPSTERHPGV